MDDLLLVVVVSLATPIVAGAIVAVGAALESRSPAPLEDRAARDH